MFRNVKVPNEGGAKCLPLEAVKTCNSMPCPVDCHLGPWNGWSKCSAACGGGVRQRLRPVKRAMKFDGRPCPATSQTESCNDQACEKDCELSAWTEWTTCSKDCDGGTHKRQRFITREAEGEGKCGSPWSSKRLQYKECAMKTCPQLTCNNTVDVMLLLDGSGSLGPKGWDATKVAAERFVRSFTGNARIAVTVFSGPNNWRGVYICTGYHAWYGVPKPKAASCGVQTLTHFTSDRQNAAKLIQGASWPKGSTLTSIALMHALTEIRLGRKGTESVVVVFTDGRPFSVARTTQASYSVRREARLMWVPVTRNQQLIDVMRRLATRRWQENIVVVKNFKDLQKPEPITHIIADMCPKHRPLL